MTRSLVLFATLILSTPSFAEKRDINATEPSETIVLAAASEDMRSFFEPKTESDLNELATLGQEFEISLSQEN